MSRRTVVLLAVLLLAIAGTSTSVSASPAPAPPVATDPVDEGSLPPIDFTGNVYPPGEEKLPTLDMASPDGPAAKGYAAEFGVTPERASEIIRWQGDMIAKLAPIAHAVGDRYVQTRMVPGEAAIEVYIFEPTRGDIQAVEQVSDGVRVLNAYADLPTLNALVESEISAALARAPGQVADATVDPATGEVTIELAPPPDHADVACTPMSTETGGQLDGGRSFHIATEYNNCDHGGACTLGFSAYLISKQGSLTAAHCVNNEYRGIGYGSATGYNGLIYSGDSEWWMEAKCQNSCNGVSEDEYSWAALRPYWADSLPDDDLAFVRERYASTQPSGRIYVSNQGFYNIIGFFDDSAGPLSGVTVCQSAGKDTTSTGAGGIGPGQHCGTIEAFYSGSPQANFTPDRWTRVDPFEDGDASGASGGPWFMYRTSSTVVGMGIHTTSNSAHTRRYYERIDPALSAMRGANGSGTTAYMFCAYGVSVQYCSATWDF